MRLAITIEDDGPGISPEKTQAILKRGARLDGQYPGQGIGLSIAQDIVLAYKGEIAISSSELGGSKFEIFLPVKVK